MGKLIVHTGSMFSGKTTALQRDLYKYKVAGKVVEAIKPIADTRNESITSHDKKETDCIRLERLGLISKAIDVKKVEVLGIDELQLFTDPVRDILYVIDYLLNHTDMIVIVAGLDLDFKGKPFEAIKELMPLADTLIKHHAICTECGEDAYISYRIGSSKNLIEIGAEDKYKPICRSCFKKL